MMAPSRSHRLSEEILTMDEAHDRGATPDEEQLGVSRGRGGGGGRARGVTGTGQEQGSDEVTATSLVICMFRPAAAACLAFGFYSV